MTIIKIASIKRILTFSLLMICSCVTYSQTKSVKDTVARSGKADKDSLIPKHILTQEQTLQIYAAHIQWGQQERELQQKYVKSDSLGLKMKNLEEKKDELYKTILPSDKYQLYKQKKLRLISSENEIIRYQ